MNVHMLDTHARLLAATVVAITMIISLAAVMISRSGAEGSKQRDEARAALQASAARQALRAQDFSAKSLARNAVIDIETCFTTIETYQGCEERAMQQLGSTALEVRDVSDTAYTVVSRSQSGTAFTYVRHSDGTTERTCDSPSKGGCEPGGIW